MKSLSRLLCLIGILLLAGCGSDESPSKTNQPSSNDCASGQMKCGDQCLDVQSDLQNCGACANVCGSAQPACVAGVCQSWATVTGYYDYGFADFTPAGQDPLLATSDHEHILRYSVSGDSWSEVAYWSRPKYPGDYKYPAWDGNSLFWIDNGQVISWVIGDADMTFTAVPSMPISDRSQTTADENHNLYAMAKDGTIIQYNTQTQVLKTRSGSADLPGPHDEPRLAWDSGSAKVYLGGYVETPFYSFDPSTGTLAKLADFPGPKGMSEALCSDRRGHLYTVDNCAADIGKFWVYDTATAAWRSFDLPFTDAKMCSGTCTVSGDGYLFLLGQPNSHAEMYKVRVF